MRFTKFAFRARFQKVKQTSHFKNLYIYLTERKLNVIVGSSIFFGLYYINQFFTRKYKGLNKLSQRFSSTDSFSPGILKSELSYYNIFFSNYQYPWAILFPKTFEEAQKIVKYAIKYGLFLTNENIDHLDAINPNSTSPYIVINQRNIKYFSFDEENKLITVGTGLTIKEINDILVKKGFYIPISSFQRNSHLFELINQDNADIIHNHFNSISELITSMNVILPNSEALCTNIHIKKNGFGVSLNEIFVGSNSTFGIPIEATMKVLPIPKKVYKLYIKGKSKDLTGEMYDLLADFKVFLKDNEDRLKQCVLRLENEGLSIQFMSFSKINYEDLFFKYFSEFDFKEKKIKAGKNSMKEIIKECLDHNNIKKEEIFKYKIDEKEFLELLTKTKDEYLKEFINLNKKALYSFSFNFLDSIFALDVVKHKEFLKENERFEELNRQILNYIVNRNGVLVNYYDKKKMYNFKATSKLIEFGKNNLHLQHHLKELFDPKNVFINESFTHEILQK